MRTPGVFALAFAAALLAGYGCSSSSSNNGGTASPQLYCADGGAAAANGVTLNCSTPVDTQTTLVDVVIGGPASGTTTLRGLNFDVTYDPAKVDFVPAANYASPLFPNGLIAVALNNGQPGDVVVSIQQGGGDPPVSVAPGQHIVLTLSFRRASGVNFSPTPLPFANSEATGASTAIGFTSGLALSYQ